MNYKLLTTCVIASLSVNALAATENSIKVTETNFVQAESTHYFNKNLMKVPVNHWLHQGIMANKDVQNVIRMNQDTMYSIAVIDVSEGATISIPARDTYQSVELLDLNHMAAAVIYAGESVTLTPKDLTTGEYVYALMRTAPKDYTKAGIEGAKKAAELVTIKANSSKPFKGMKYDQRSLEQVRNKLIKEMNNGGIKDLSRIVGKTEKDINKHDHLIAVAAGYAALPAKDAMYAQKIPNQGGSQCSSYTIKKPDLKYNEGGFFSLTTYDHEGWIVKDKFALNSKQAIANKDGSYTFHFNCDNASNNIDVVDDWTGILRLYRPVSVNKTLNYLDYIKTDTAVKPTML